jgi:catechol 2,3-dioxygenase-like lactoylglutathione lyase family enzyme
MTKTRELRFAFTFDDYEGAVRLFRDVLGLQTVMDLERDGGRGVILAVPSATLEVFDALHTDAIDRIEVGRPTGDRVRIAVRVDELDEAAASVAIAGVEPIAEPVLTPWGDRNQRFRLPDGLQLTLFAGEEG